MIEAVFALGILGFIASLLLPSLNTLMTSSNVLKNESKIIFAMEAAIEKEKANIDSNYGSKLENINQFAIKINREPYTDNLDKISVNYGKYKLEVIEENHEKKRIHSY